MDPAIIKIGIDPFIHLGPVTIAWHGLTIALGILAGGLVGSHEAKQRRMDPEPLLAMGMIVVVAALVGGKLYYVMEHGSGLLSTRGFTFYGGFIAAALGLAFYVRRNRLPVAYLDVIAVALPLGLAVGRIGDIINGEHFGPQTHFLLGVQNTHPDADVPRHDVAYHSGGLYEVLIGAVVFAIVWPLRKRLRRPTAMVWTVIALLAAGRFIEFFARSDSKTLALGLETAQWTSLLLIVIAAVGAWFTRTRQRSYNS
jgi:phosphatidylglycerol---prolipoprotein diacylglyceryl transferase